MAEPPVTTDPLLNSMPPTYREVKRVLLGVRSSGEYQVLEAIQKQLERGWFLYKIEGGNPIAFENEEDGKTILANNDAGNKLNLFFAVLNLTP